MMTDNKTLRFLVADDDIDDRLLISDAFAKCQPDFGLDLVEDGEEALQFLRRQGDYQDLKSAPLPDVIILDLNMPRKDGRAVLKEIKKDPRLQVIPVIVLTTSRADDDVVSLYELGASSFITKPISYENLCKVVSGMCHYWSDVVALPKERAS